MKAFILLCAAVCTASASAQQARLPVLHPTFTTLGTVRDTTVNWQAAASPNGRFIAYTSTTGDFRIFDTRSKRSHVIGGAMKWGSWPSWSPKGDMIAFTYVAESGDASVYAIDVEPATGSARGTPRRVTINGGINPAVSPDGKWIAYNRTDNDNKPITDLLIVPAQGGTPRKLVTGPLAMPTRWSPDGRWIYYVIAGQKSAFADGSSEFDVYRVGADGTSPQLVSRTAGTWPGLTPDGRYIVTRSGSVTDTLRRAVVTDAVGKPLAVFTSPLGDQIGHWVDNYRFLTVRDDQKRQLRAADIDGKWSRDLAVAGTSVATAAYSPDGKRIAAFQRNGSRTTLIVMSADGKLQRVLPIRNLTGYAQPTWSPNGRYVAYTANRDADRTISVYDVNSGIEHVVVSGTQPLSRDLHWRATSKSLLYSRIKNVGPSAELGDLAIHEVTIDGNDHALRDIPHEALSNGKGPAGIRFGDSMAVSVGSSGVWAIPYSGGSARLIKREGTTRTTFSSAGRSLVHGIDITGDRSFKSLEVLGLDGQMIRNVRLTFEGYTTTNDRSIVLTPDGRSAIIVGRDEASDSAKIYRVPLDGSAAAAIVALPSRFSSQIDVAPDGRSILYTVLGPEASSFVLVDLTKDLTRLSRNP